MHDLAIYDDLITSLITLNVKLEEELKIIILRNRLLGRPNNVEEEIDLRRQTKKKIDNVEELNKEVKE